MKTSACLLMHIILKIIYGLGMGCFYLYQWLLPEPPSEINYSFHAFFLCNDLLETGGYQQLEQDEKNNITID